MPVVTLNLKTEQITKVEEYAKRHGISISEAARQCFVVKFPDSEPSKSDGEFVDHEDGQEQ